MSFTGVANWRKWALQMWAQRASPSGKGKEEVREDTFVCLQNDGNVFLEMSPECEMGKI
jgi:hypothetical protein